MTRAGILLDRDGTIIVDRGYLADPAGVELERGAREGMRALAALRLPMAVVSNQSGVGRGLFSAAAVDAVNTRVAAVLSEAGVVIDAWYHCPHAPDETCDCRKPLPGMALAAARDLGLDLARSFVIGDKSADLGLARAVGATGILVRTGEGAAVAPDGLACADLREAAAVIARLLAERQEGAVT